MVQQVHIIGAGLSGLAAAVRLAGQGLKVQVHEAAGQAGGRCRSYHDPSLDMVIDNGNHLLLSANHAALDYVRALGAENMLSGPDKARFPFCDLASGARWTIEISDGRLPWWIFDAARRVPGTRARDYLALARLLWPPADAAIGEVVKCSGPLYERLVRPLMLAALNTEPKEASAALASEILRETLLEGGAACRPLIAHEGLSAAFVDPALAFLRRHGADIRFGRRLRAIDYEAGRAVTLRFGDDDIGLGPDAAVIVAVPPVVAATLVPDLTVPTDFRAIVNAHFKVAPPSGVAPITGVVNATTEWLFAFDDRLSVTVSGADRLLDIGREELAQTIWREVARVAGLPEGDRLPPWQIVRERRATFAALPAENRKRPSTAGRWANLFLAGDWTATGLPATIEGAIRSGFRAAELVAPA
jgi:squalene-associated FAD-dependent desaturase